MVGGESQNILEEGIHPTTYRERGFFSHGVLKQLRLTKDTVKKIAQDVGFSSEYHFSNAFKRIMGCAPGELRGGLSPLASAAAIKKDESTTP